MPRVDIFETYALFSWLAIKIDLIHQQGELKFYRSLWNIQYREPFTSSVENSASVAYRNATKQLIFNLKSAFFDISQLLSKLSKYSFGTKLVIFSLELLGISFLQNSSIERSKKAHFGPIFQGLVAVLCAMDFNNIHHSELRRPFHEKLFCKIKKVISLYYTVKSPFFAAIWNHEYVPRKKSLTAFFWFFLSRLSIAKPFFSVALLYECYVFFCLSIGLKGSGSAICILHQMSLFSTHKFVKLLALLF